MSKFDIKKIRRTIPEKIIFVVAFIIFAIYAFTLLFTFVWTISSSLKTNKEFARNLSFFPQGEWQFVNYAKAFEELNINGTNFIGMIFNSLWLTLGRTAANIFTCCVTGYVIAKYDFKFGKIFYAVAIFVMVIPIMGNLPSQYNLYYALHMNNSPMILIASFSGIGFNFIVMHSFFKGVPWSYAEASFIDGGGHFLTFFKIMLPLVKGPAFALAITAIIGNWNDYMTAILYLDRMTTLATGLYEYQKELQDGHYNDPVYFAGVMLSMIPVLTLFAIFTDKIMNNVMVGGLKG